MFRSFYLHFLTDMVCYIHRNSQKSGYLMKKIFVICIVLCLLCILVGCNEPEYAQILATTKPVHQFTKILCQDTPLTIDLLISENVSCLHDYSLQVKQMQKLENAELIVINGAGFEDFLTDAMPDGKTVIDCSKSIDLYCPTTQHDDGHHHEGDPHIWLSIPNAKSMVKTIYAELCVAYPQHKETFTTNLQTINCRLSALEAEADLATLKTRKIITFHDGFTYLANSFNLEIVKAIEEESGSEASAKELIEIINAVKFYNLPAIFTEVSGNSSSASTIQRETGVKVFELDMGLSERNYFEAMTHNITTLKEALE